MKLKDFFRRSSSLEKMYDEVLADQRSELDHFMQRLKDSRLQGFKPIEMTQNEIEELFNAASPCSALYNGLWALRNGDMNSINGVPVIRTFADKKTTEETNMDLVFAGKVYVRPCGRGITIEGGEHDGKHLDDLLEEGDAVIELRVMKKGK